MQHIGSNSDVLKLLRGYIRSLESSALATSVEGREIVRRHMLDLVAIAATPHQSIGESSLSAVAAAHTHAIFDHLASHFSDPELSLSNVALSLQISPRYVQRLLEASGTSFTAYVTELRLKHAFMLLTAPDKSDVRICGVALQAGFSDISHFNRLFRSRFGDTPSEVRAQGHGISTQEAKTLRPFRPGLSDLGTNGLASRRGGRAGLRRWVHFSPARACMHLLRPTRSARLTGNDAET
jgi:AraC-like DNA-binding protein